ncbi:polysaccharide deacetylase family protein [Caldimonas thermodepolymerans]|uniref:polysaccharide deacetylase family protein n=1 Tax=Caldimonas thermodepolymerans TaxID=215580 RepID=UPI0022364A38|nr:polysaccharide deacetylase family protein [Caldimonas thermodepolymerans]UZG45807.1 polysaccharide deacetylase family protein [Caldimonas thermodepolymerans]
MLARYAKTFVKATVSPVVDALGVYDRRIAVAAGGAGHWTILMYHRVIADPAADPFRLGMCVRRDRFEAQIAWLRRHFNVIGLREAVDRLERGEPLPERALSVTFDDGYRDNLDVALPILEAHGVPFTLFVPTGGLDTDEQLWWDRVIAALAGTGRETLDTGALDLPGQPVRLSLSSWRRAITAEEVLQRLWTLPIDETLAAVERIERVLGPAVRPVVRAQRLSSAQIREMHRRGVEIGAHSVRHPNLQLVSCVHELQREMTVSRQQLEALCQAPIDGFAYPGGRMNADTVAAARAVGFRYAVATISAVNRAPYDRFQLCRIGMPDAPLADFKRAFSTSMTRQEAGRHAFTA